LSKRKPGFSGKIVWSLENPFKTGFAVLPIPFFYFTNYPITAKPKGRNILALCKSVGYRKEFELKLDKILYNVSVLDHF
jgi:hypothetical protein